MAVNIFDANFYRAANPDLATAGLTTDAQVWSHFQTYGVNEGRAFSPFVDLNLYRTGNSDLAGLNNQQLFEHLQNYGIREDRHFSNLIDLDFYRQANSDLSKFSSEQAFQHLQTYGVSERRQFSPFIDLKFYCQSNSDLSKLDYASALQHLEIYGLSEGRQFSPLIDLNFYRQVNSDLSKFNHTSALQHLESYGLGEGREFSPIFSVNYYKAHNPDLVGMTNSQLLQHYELYGIKEGRQVEPTLNGQIALGMNPTPEHDLIYRGGKTIANLNFYNIYLGGTNWDHHDIQQIDASLSAAMSDRRLNSIVSQYFPGQKITSNFLGSRVTEDPVPSEVSKQYIETLISRMGSQSEFKGFDLNSTVFDYMLPKNTILSTDTSSSLEGLSGYHGSVHFQSPDGMATAYYVIGVYSENYNYLGVNNVNNGNPVFNEPWKNVVATAYHELNEVRTDADAEDAVRTKNLNYVGWNSVQGEEIGDYPIKEANGITFNNPVFREIPLANGQGTVPIQLQYSNAVHGPTDPTTVS